MDHKKDQKVLIGLAYYSNSLLQDVSMDAGIGKLLYYHLIASGHSTLSVEDIREETLFLMNTLKNEFLLRDTRALPDAIRHRLEMLRDEKELTIDTDPQTGKDVLRLSHDVIKRQALIGQGNVPDGHATFSMINFLKELSHHIMDTYLVVLIALDGIISGNMVIKEKNLIESLHFAIIDMYNENLLPSL